MNRKDEMYEYEKFVSCTLIVDVFIYLIVLKDGILLYVLCTVIL